jgi:hypothetical protein
MKQAQEILASLGNDPRPQIKAPNNESILLALLPALFGAGTNYIGQMGQGYMAGQNQELALIEQERRRREQNILRQAQAVQSQAQDLGNRENLMYTQASQNFRNEQDNTRALTNTEMVQAELNKRFGIGDQTKRDIAGDKLELDRERVEVGNAAKLWAMALKEANMDGSVTEADVIRLEALRQDIGGEKYASRLVIPPIGSSWQKIKNDADMVYKRLVLAEQTRRNQANESLAGQRINNTGGSRSGGGKGGGARPPALGGELQLENVSPKVAAGKATTADANIKKYKKAQSLLDPVTEGAKRRALEVKIQTEVVTRDYYQRIMRGEMPMFDPGAPNTDAGKDAAAKAKADAEKAAAAKALAGANQTPAPSGAGIRLENSYAKGGDRSQKTQAEVDAEKKAAEVKAGQTPSGKKYFPAKG